MFDHSTSWCVLIPCFNEEKAIREVVCSAIKLGRPVIVVDDGSQDRTADIVSELPVTLLRHDSKRGKGEALRTGFREALRMGVDAVATMDGDGQHLAADIPRMAAASRLYPGAVIIGARLVDREQQPASRRRANAVADWWISWACAQPVVDTQSGQRWYPRAALELAESAEEGFVFETAILIRASREAGLGVVSIPIASRYQTNFRHSHFRPVADTTRITAHVARCMFRYGQPISSFQRAHRSPTIAVVLSDDASAAEPLNARHRSVQPIPRVDPGTSL
ncbi:glycosyltransferase family 2 protein [Rhodanobacter sp. MP7CTX1]|jgi:glycosyltransferase involved in cell wall biosynthesis|uniref:glycosyltransferase family 2 protein n=1 Tax=Rhodanobacter sp. MP7CTX1 TaxID=2723084 RepID=UPI00161464A7|nr:glycosyltransferase family 2 protein [Rhodanobacter sp. MP7CTX1]MBB6186072.1 glycosyltransferase involved in cell wall biosynthesis [Rhodanobacter sp. MP7CTX1]